MRLAECTHSVFSFKEAVEAEGPRLTLEAAAKPGGRAGPAVPRPGRLVVEERGAGNWAATWRWFGWQYVPLAFFCVAWDAFLIFWYSMAFGSKDTPWIMIVFPIGHLAVGVGLTYTVLTGFVNRTRIDLSRSALTVRHGPLPWTGGRTLPAAQIKQLYCEQGKGQENGQGGGYKLCALMKDGRKVVLISGSPDTDIPRYVEKELERRLKIGDAPVAGEV